MTGGRLEFEAVSKRYGQMVALSDFTHTFQPGLVHALMGKNGSGKSTLVKILAGATLPTSGTVRIAGKEAHFHSPHDAFGAGIVTVHQELSLVPELSVGENIFLGRLPKSTRFGVSIVDWRRLHRMPSACWRRWAWISNSRKQVASLSVGQQQVVEIAKAMSFEPSILLLDEPTSALATREVKQLFALIDRLRARGVTMIYITHRMNEPFDDRRHLHRAARRTPHRVGRDGNRPPVPPIVEMMFGESAHAVRPERRVIDRSGTPVLEVNGTLPRRRVSKRVLQTASRRDPRDCRPPRSRAHRADARRISAPIPQTQGPSSLVAAASSTCSPKSMKDAGLGYTPENRKEVGLVQMLSTADNLCLASLAAIAPSRAHLPRLRAALRRPPDRRSRRSRPAARYCRCRRSPAATSRRS